MSGTLSSGLNCAAPVFSQTAVWTTAAPFLLRESTGSSPPALCPDLLRYSQLGEADGWRGRVVRAFFWCLQVWPS